MRVSAGLCALVAVACIAGAHGHYSSCSHMRHRQAEYLDRQTVGQECSATSPMSGFGLQNSGCGGEDMRYKYECGNLVSSTSSYEKTSGCEALRHKDNEYLDRQDPFCAANEAMVKHTVVGCNGDYMEYKFTCAQLSIKTESTTHYSSCEAERHKKLEYLDRLDVQCPEGEWLNGFVMEGCSGEEMRYKYTCLKDVTESPPPPSPPSVPPPPLGFEDYPGTQCKQWTDSKDDKDDGVYIRHKKVGSIDDCKAICMEDPNACYGIEYYANKLKCDIFTHEITSFKYVKNTDKDYTCSVNREMSLVPLSKYRKNGKEGDEYVLPEHLSGITYDTLSESGKCTVNSGQDPKHEYYHEGSAECESHCDDNDSCYGYSASTSGNCLIWLEGPIDNSPGDQWGGAYCHVKMQDGKAYEAASSKATSSAPTLLVFAVVGAGIAASIVAVVIYRRRESTATSGTKYALVLDTNDV